MSTGVNDFDKDLSHELEMVCDLNEIQWVYFNTYILALREEVKIILNPFPSSCVNVE
jgi:hypothetical protein